MDGATISWELFGRNFKWEMGNGKSSQPQTPDFQGDNITIHFPFDISHLKLTQTDPPLGAVQKLFVQNAQDEFVSARRVRSHTA